MIPTCQHCGSETPTRLQWQTTSRPTIKHIRATCRTCGRFVKFVRQDAEAVAAADVESPWQECLPTLFEGQP